MQRLRPCRSCAGCRDRRLLYTVGQCALDVSSTPGHGLAAKAPPDGYTLLLGTSAGLMVAPSLGVKLSYDPMRDFVSIGQAVNAPFGMTLHAAVLAFQSI